MTIQLNKLLYIIISRQILQQQLITGTLAEWLSRRPAKPVPSGARVRIPEVSHNNPNLFFFLDRVYIVIKLYFSFRYVVFFC
jgi:hypothetical protein